jgi:PIN domain nuclease of toxin-antitoxin system
VIYLVDTHLLLWAALQPERLSAAAMDVLEDRTSGLMFSSAAIWEVAIKTSKGRPDFRVDPRLLRRALLENGYAELPISSEHAVAVAHLPGHHGDPFDRIQVAQARVEGVVFLTGDSVLADYGFPVQLV